MKLKRVDERFVKFHCSVGICQKKSQLTKKIQKNPHNSRNYEEFFLTTLVWVRASNIVYDCIKEIDNLTISTDNVMIQIRPPGLVTLFLSLVGDVMLIQKG